MKTLTEIAKTVHSLAVEKGWYEEKDTTTLTPSAWENAYMERCCNNLHDKVSELHEAWRNNQLRKPCDKAEKMIALGIKPLTCLEEELADIVIRACDNAVELGVDIEAAVESKHAYNATRSQRHGGKKS